MKKLTREWVRKAEADFRAAKKLTRAKPPLADSACFHCQQTIEKYFKALLQEWGLPVPKIHSLERLQTLLPTPGTAFAGYRQRLKAVSKYAVEYRYPGIFASVRQARSAMRFTTLIRGQARRLLGLRAR